MFQKLLIVVLAISFTSCASYMKRKECENTNWFEHGKKVALSGKWLNSDTHLMECRKVEASISESQVDQGFKNGLQIYCSPTEAYNVGKSGTPYSNDLCEGPQSTVLRQKHKQGIEDYCHKSNGYNAGSSGKKYQNVCPANLEPAFLVEYKKGRKKYVSAAIDVQNSSLTRKSMELNSQKMRTSMARMNLTRAETRLSTLRTQSSLNSSVEQQSLLSNLIRDAESEERAAQSDYNSSLNEENRLAREVSNIESTLNTLRMEMASLD